MYKLIAVATIACFFNSSALACGESLYRVGKGIVYREYTAPLPGNILLVAETDAEKMLADALQRAGHNVRVIASADEVGSTLNYADFDIVLSRYQYRRSIESAIADDVQYLPVARHGTDEVKLAKTQYQRALKDTDHIKRFLIQIHRTLKTQKA